MDDLTTVLVHGGGATGRAWDRLLPHLAPPTLAVDLPGRGALPADLGSITVEEEVAAVVTVAGTAAGDVVLVAHSSGGLVVPGVVAALDGRVRAVVLVAALVPPEGGCGLDCMKPAHRDGLVAIVEQAAASGGPPITLPGPPPDVEPFRTAYGGDPLSDDELSFVTDPLRCVPDTVHHYFQPVHWSQAGDVPVTYVHTERDRPVAPAKQLEMIDLLPRRPTVVRLQTGHLPMVTDPAALAAAVSSARVRAAAYGPGMAADETLSAPIPGATHQSFGPVEIDVTEVGDARIRRCTYPPGMRWSTDLKPLLDTDLCEHAHVGFLASGALTYEYADGCAAELVAPAVVDVAPGHDAYVVGDAPAVVIEVDFLGDTVTRMGLRAEHSH